MPGCEGVTVNLCSTAEWDERAWWRWLLASRRAALRESCSQGARHAGSCHFGFNVGLERSAGHFGSIGLDYQS